MGPMTAQDSQTTEQHPHRAWMIPGTMLLVTGCCALVYQVCWLRGLRLVFGASTAANAAVLAIFMGGLGLGALRLGPWADRHRHPLALYGKLELCVAVSCRSQLTLEPVCTGIHLPALLAGADELKSTSHGMMVLKDLKGWPHETMPPMNGHGTCGMREQKAADAEE